MNTVLKEFDNNAADEAAVILKNGGLVAFPTETVYGLGANGLDVTAVKKIFEAKGRPQDNPLILHISNMDMLNSLVTDVPENALKLAESFWPGPLTIVFNKTETVPLETSGGLNTVAIRFPANKAALSIISKAGLPIAAPSANTSGKPSPTQANHVYYDLNGRVDLIIDGGSCTYGLESTIIDITENIPCLLRPGAVTKEMIEEVIGEISVDKCISHAVAGEKPKAPGMLYTHYSPLADLVIVLGDYIATVKKINALALNEQCKTGILATQQTINMYDKNKFVVLSVGDRDKKDTIAANLFNTLRKFDYYGVSKIYAEGFSEEGLGMAIMNRLKKAAGYNMINC